MSGRSRLLGEALRVLADAGRPLDTHEVLDVLWLASRLPADPAELPLARAVLSARRPVEPPPEPPDEPPAAGAEPDEAGAAPEEEALADFAPELHAAAAPRPKRSSVPTSAPPPRDTRAALPMRLAGERALRDELRLGRALRPLKQRRPSPTAQELDETATAAALAETRLPDVVLRPVRERWLDLALVIDDGLSMLLWHRLAAELRNLLQCLGAFRMTNVYGLDSHDATAPVLRARPFSQDSATCPVTLPTDPSGRTLVIVVSDGLGPAWRSGALHEVLGRWAKAGPVAIIHTLPPGLWEASGIQASRWEATTQRPGGANVAWHIADPLLPPELATFDGVPVPVLEPTDDSVRAFSQLIASPGTTVELPLLVRSAGRAPAVSVRDRGSLQHFRNSASPEAYRFAAHLAAVSPVTVPVMRLVQSAVPWKANTAHLAEVFLGGLMHPVPAPVAGSLPLKHRVFDFTEAGKTALLDAVPTAELLATGRAVGRRLEQLAGRSPDFPAWLAHRDGSDLLPRAFRPFTVLERRLMARFGLTMSPEPATEEAEAAPDTYWRPLADTDPARLGDYELLARHEDDPTIAYLGRSATNTLALVRTVPPQAPEARAALSAESEALRRMGGRYAPLLLGTGLGSDPPWIATQLIASSARDNSPPPSLGDVIGGRYTTTTRPMDVLTSIALSAQLANTLNLCHVNDLIPAGPSLDSFVLVGRTVALTTWSDCVVDGAYPGRGRAPDAADNMRALGEMMRRIASGREDRRQPMHLWLGDMWQPLRELVERCADPDPESRPSAGEAARILARYVAIAARSAGRSRGGATAAEDTARPPLHASALPLSETPQGSWGRGRAGAVFTGPEDSQLAAIRRPLVSNHRITVVGVGPNTGRLTTTVALGHVFAEVRGQPVLALDGAPARGDLHERISVLNAPPDGSVVSLPLGASHEEFGRYTTATHSALEILAYSPLHRTSVVAYADEYRRTAELAGPHYPVVITDWAAQVDRSIATALDMTDTLVVCCTISEDSVKSTQDLLDRIASWGYHSLTARAVVVVTRLSSGHPPVKAGSVPEYFRRSARHTVVVPFDQRLMMGREIALAKLRGRTRAAYLDLAAQVAADFGT